MKNVPRANNIFLVTPHFDLWPALTVDFHFKPYKCWISSHTALSFHQYGEIAIGLIRITAPVGTSPSLHDLRKPKMISINPETFYSASP